MTPAPIHVAGERLLLEGSESGGQDIHAPAIRALFPHGARVFLLGRERLASCALAGRPPSLMPPRGRLHFRSQII